MLNVVSLNEIESKYVRMQAINLHHRRQKILFITYFCSSVTLLLRSIARARTFLQDRLIDLNAWDGNDYSQRVPPTPRLPTHLPSHNLIKQLITDNNLIWFIFP